VHLGIGQTPRHRRAGCAGADDQDVNGIVLHYCSLGFLFPSFRGTKRTRNLEIPGSVLRIAPE
jgi:hypothetical protein